MLEGAISYIMGKEGEDMSKKIMLIDGSSLIFRAFYALPKLTNSEGVLTNGVYGFLTMYFNALETYQPDYCLVAFDRATKTFRHEEYEAYKGNRDKAPSELTYQFGILKDILDSLRVKHLDMDGFEADDILGTYAKGARQEGLSAIIVTGDRDYLQLVDDNIKVFLTKKGVSQTEEYDEAKIAEEYGGLSPKQLIEVKGLQGDNSDNIPGVPGIGPKKAISYIKDYGSIEGLYDHLDEISGPKTRQALEDNEALAYMSKKIGTIVTNVPVEYSYEDLKLVDPDIEGLKEKFTRYDFNKFLERLPEGDQEEEREEFSYEFISPEDDLESLLKGVKELTFLTIFDGTNYIHSNPLYFSFLPDGGRKAYILNLKEDFPEKLAQVLKDDGIPKLTFDIKKERVLLSKLGLEIGDRVEDLMLAQYLIDPSRSSYTIKDLSSIYLSYQVQDREELLGKGKKAAKFEDLEEEKLGDFLSASLNGIKDSCPKVMDKLKSFEMTDLYRQIELSLSKVLSEMEEDGIITSREVLEEISKKLDKDLEGLIESIYSYAGYEFNINSTKQLGKLLFEDLGLPPVKKTKTGYSTDAKVLSKLRDKHPIIREIEKYRELFKLKTTYIEGLEEAIDEDGRIRSTFNQNVTATGRLSSQDPNLQNLPIKTDEGREIRKAFQAGEGKILIDADYSQIELRVLAHLSGDKKMQEAFKEGVDIHTKTASEVFNTPVDQVTKLQRSNAKAVNFGIIYGISDYGLSQNLNIPRKLAKEYIDNYLETYPDIKAYMGEIVDKAREDGYVETLFKRRRYIPEISSKNFNLRSFGERVALNTPIQGTAADIIKIAMVKANQALKKEGLDAKIILQIHDEIIIEASLADADRAEEILKESMETAADLDVDLNVDINRGKNLYESK